MGIAQAQRESGDREAARETLDMALQDAEYRLRHDPQIEGQHQSHSPFEQRKDFARSEIARIEAMRGDFEGARRTADSITEERIKAFAFGDIARFRAEAGDATGAIEWAETLSDPRLKDQALQGIAVGLSKAMSAR